MKKIIAIILTGVFIGGIFSLYMFSNIKKSVAMSINDEYNVTAFQAGVFNIYDNAKKEANKYDYAFIYKDNDKYRVYIAVYQNKYIIGKLSNYYKSNDKSVYLRKISVNSKFLDTLKKYEELLKNVDDINTIINANKNILEEFKSTYDTSN